MSTSSSSTSRSNSSPSSSRPSRAGTRKTPGSSSSTTGAVGSCSSVSSPTISSSASSMVTRPAMPPYSSTTIAMCDEPLCSSRSSSSTGFDSGTNTAGRASDDAGASSIASCSWRSDRPAGAIGQPADDVLEVEHAAQVVHGVADERDAGEPGAQQQRERLAQRGVLGRGHHVRARHHDLAGERVAQLEDGAEHLPLLVLDDVRLADPLHHVPQLVLVLGGRPGPGSTRRAPSRPATAVTATQHARQRGSRTRDRVPAAERARAGPHQQERHEPADGDRDEQHRPPRQVRRRDRRA